MSQNAVCLRATSHFPCDEVQNEAEVRGSTPVSASDWGKNTAAWASLISLCAMQLEVELLCSIVVLFVDSFSLHF